MHKLQLRNILVLSLVVGLVFGLTSAFQGVTSATEADFSELLGMIEPAIVKVTPVFHCKVGEKSGLTLRSSGTGFVVSEEGNVVTAWHVVNEVATAANLQGKKTKCLVDDELKEGVYTGETDILIEVPKEANPQEFREDAYRAEKIKKANAFYDIALLQTDITSPTQIWAGDSSAVQKGDGGFVIGYPAPNDELTVTEHQIANHVTKKEDQAVITVDGTKFHLVDPQPIKEDEEVVGLLWKYAILPAPNAFSIIEVKVALKGEGFSPCEAKVEGAEEINCNLEPGTLEYLQKDDAVDAGNSGGHIFNWNGQVIGIALIDKSEVNEEGKLRVTAEYHLAINKVKDILGIGQ